MDRTNRVNIEILIDKHEEVASLMVLDDLHWKSKNSTQKRFVHSVNPLISLLIEKSGSPLSLWSKMTRSDVMNSKEM